MGATLFTCVLASCAYLLYAKQSEHRTMLKNMIAHRDEERRKI